MTQIRAKRSAGWIETVTSECSYLKATGSADNAMRKGAHDHHYEEES